MAKSWTFHSAGQLVFGSGVITELGELTQRRGCKKVLIDTDEALMEAGAVAAAQDSLVGGGVEVEVFAGGEPEPSMQVAESAAEVARSFQPDAVVGIGGGIYLVSNLGAGPRDGLMIGLQKVTNLPVAAVRAFLEISVVSIGWYLGGTVGVGTLLFAFGIGPCVALGLFLVDKIFD